MALLSLAAELYLRTGTVLVPELAFGRIPYPRSWPIISNRRVADCDGRAKFAARLEGAMKRYKSIPLLIPALFAAFFILFCGDAPGVEQSEKGTLMLVREWDPKTGELVGWLPIHRAAIRLTILDDRTLRFDLNDAVTIEWLARSKLIPPFAQVVISPEPRLFEGERWLPVKRDGNVVRIARRLFLIRSIILGESKWRLPTAVGLLPHEKK
jgi:hypothetical protein